MQEKERLEVEIKIRRHIAEKLRGITAMLSEVLGLALLLSDQATSSGINDVLRKMESIREFNMIALTAAKAVAEERLPLED